VNGANTCFGGPWSPTDDLERFNKNRGRLERGFLGFGGASAMAQVENPVTEPKRSQNPKRPFHSLSGQMAAVFLDPL